MKESTLLEMQNKIKAITNVLQQLINEQTHLRDLSVGTLEALKLMPGYEKAIEFLKKEVTKKDIDDFREKVRKEYYSLESIDISDDNSVVDFEILNYEEEQKKLFTQKEVRVDLNTDTKEEIFIDLKKVL